MTNERPDERIRYIPQSDFSVRINASHAFDIMMKQRTRFELAIVESDKYAVLITREADNTLRVNDHIVNEGHKLIQFFQSREFVMRAVPTMKLILHQSDHIRRVDIRFDGKLWFTLLISRGHLWLATPNGAEVCQVMQTLLEMAINRGRRSMVEKELPSTEFGLQLQWPRAQGAQGPIPANNANIGQQNVGNQVNPGQRQPERGVDEPATKEDEAAEASVRSEEESEHGDLEGEVWHAPGPSNVQCQCTTNQGKLDAKEKKRAKDGPNELAGGTKRHE